MRYNHVTTGYYNWRPVKLSNGEIWEYINTGKWWRLWEVKDTNKKLMRFETLTQIDKWLTEYIETNNLSEV